MTSRRWSTTQIDSTRHSEGATEEWRPVVDWEDLYEVSDLGRVRSIPRLCDGGLGSKAMRGGIVLKRSMDAGRARVNLYRNNKPTLSRVYVLVAEAFLGPRPHPEHVVRHLNDVPDDDRLCNLAWGSQADNIQDAIRNGKVGKRTDRCPRGHWKQGANVHGKNGCRACTLAQTKAGKFRRAGAAFDVHAEADANYARLMGQSA